LSSHLDKCIVTLGHFSTTNISPGATRRQGLGHRGADAPCPPSGAAHSVYSNSIMSAYVYGSGPYARAVYVRVVCTGH